MINVKEIVKRLKNPSVIISIASQIIAIMVMLKINVDTDLLTNVVMAVTTILVTLGIISNPTTQNKGYGDDFFFCENCGERTIHTKIGENMVCSECGNALKQEKEIKQ